MAFLHYLFVIRSPQTREGCRPLLGGAQIVMSHLFSDGIHQEQVVCQAQDFFEHFETICFFQTQ